MNSGRVEKRNGNAVGDLAQDQWQLGAGENDSLDSIPLFHLLHNGQ